MPPNRRLRKTVKIVGALFALCAVCLGWLIGRYAGPTNAADNASSAKRAEMLRITLDVADLAPLPASASGVMASTEGNQFTRSFRVEYFAGPAAVDKWLKASNGIKHAKVSRVAHRTTYVIEEPRNNFQRAEITIDHSENNVLIYVSKS